MPLAKLSVTREDFRSLQDLVFGAPRCRDVSLNVTWEAGELCLKVLKCVSYYPVDKGLDVLFVMVDAHNVDHTLSDWWTSASFALTYHSTWLLAGIEYELWNQLILRINIY